MLLIRKVFLVGGLVALCGCATTAKTGGAPDPVGNALQQPMRDLSLIRDHPPPQLLAAAAAPYSLAEAPGCSELAREITALDAVLGPDVDVPPAERTLGSGLAGDLIGGALGVPYRGIIRTVTGASRRDRDLKAAILAGMVRRGFLKGRLGATCGPKLAAPAPSLAPDT